MVWASTLWVFVLQKDCELSIIIIIITIIIITIIIIITMQWHIQW